MAESPGSRVRAPASVRARMEGRRILAALPCGLTGGGVSSLGPHTLFVADRGRALGYDSGARQGTGERILEFPVLLDHPEIRYGVLVPTCRGGAGDDPLQLHLRLANERNEGVRSVVRREVREAVEAVGSVVGAGPGDWYLFTLGGILPVSGREPIGCLVRGRIEAGVLRLEHSPVLGEDASLTDHLDALEEGPVLRDELALGAFEGLAPPGTGPAGPRSEAYRAPPGLGIERVLLAGRFTLGGVRGAGLELHLPGELARELEASLPRARPLWVPRPTGAQGTGAAGRRPPGEVTGRAAADPVGAVREAPVAAPGVCGVCGDPLADPLRDCPICESRLHQDCWTWVEGCATYACAGRGRNLPPFPRTRRRSEDDGLAPVP